MASTYSDLKIELIGTGEQVGTWGSTTNTNLGTALEEAIVESADVSFSSSDVTLTLTNTNGTQAARHLRLNLTGTSGGARNLILGSGCQIEKPYIINNGLADTVTVKNTTGTSIAVPAGKSMWVYNNGTNVVEVTTHTPVSSGGTGAYTLTANNVILGNGTSAVQFVAPGTSGNVLTSNGTTWTSSAAFVTGMIMLWSGSIASIPSGWVLCDGNNSTPDLRDRFVVGAGSTYAVDASGGSLTTGNPSVADTGSTTLTTANLPAHDHFVSNTDIAYTNTALTNSNYVKRGGGASGALEVYTLAGSATAPTIGLTSQTGSGTGHTHTLDHTHTSTPPYYALAYIMKT